MRMQHKKVYIGKNMRTASVLMLFPLFVFMLFSCPVKRAMLSAFLPAETTTYADVQQDQSVSGFSSDGSVHCSQGEIVFEEVSSFLASGSNSVIPVSIVHAGVLGKCKPVFQKLAFAGHRHRTYLNAPPLFLYHQSFLI